MKEFRLKKHLYHTHSHYSKSPYFVQKSLFRVNYFLQIRVGHQKFKFFSKSTFRTKEGILIKFDILGSSIKFAEKCFRRNTCTNVHLTKVDFADHFFSQLFESVFLYSIYTIESHL